jgi:UDP-glucose 4-epimerase
MRILLTGAAGYIGSHTWVLLEQAGFQVVGVDDHRNSSPRVLDRLARLLGHAPEFERADVCDSAAMADVLAPGTKSTPPCTSLPSSRWANR